MQSVPIEVIIRLPIPIVLRQPDGKSETFHLPHLGTRGLLPWLAERTQERRQAAERVLAKIGLAKIDEYRARKAIELDEAIISDLVDPAQTPDGIERILRLSLEKSDVPAERRQEVLQHIMGVAYVAANLAQELSTLFKDKEVAVEPDQPKAGGQSGPLASSGSEIQNQSAAA